MRECIYRYQRQLLLLLSSLTQLCVVSRRMSFAIDNAEIFLYAVSERYKESGNCRLEANVRTPAGSATYLGPDSSC